jgi:hypothetical protein
MRLRPNFYPKAPAMRLPQTQNLTGRKIDYMIHNGIRWTRMPAWGESDRDPHSWKLVLFIGHLPQLAEQEAADMERDNPTSAIEREEKQLEEKRLNASLAEDSSATVIVFVRP